jgi:hypothetical protein
LPEDPKDALLVLDAARELVEGFLGGASPRKAAKIVPLRSPDSDPAA